MELQSLQHCHELQKVKTVANKQNSHFLGKKNSLGNKPLFYVAYFNLGKVNLKTMLASQGLSPRHVGLCGVVTWSLGADVIAYFS